VNATLRVLAIGFSWMLIWGIVTFGAIALTTDQRMHGAVSAVVGITLLAASLGLLLGLVYRLVIEIFAANAEEFRRLRADIVLGTVVCVIILLALATASYLKKRLESHSEIQKAASVMRPCTTAIGYQILTLCSGPRYNASPDFTSNAGYHASIFLTVSERYSAGE
jgi:hypothetical protein